MKTRRSVTVESVRAAAQTALGDDRLAGVRADEPLLRSGLVTSIELVQIVVTLERRFSRSLPAMALDPATASLTALAGLLDEQSPGARGFDRPESQMLSSLKRVARRPAWALFGIGLWLLGLDVGLSALMRGPLREAYTTYNENGRRLFPHSGALSHDDFAFAVAQHEISRDAPGPPTWVVLGDSGTFGVFLPAHQSIPSQLEAKLRDSGRPTRVANLAWFGRSFVKDLMLLELVWERPIEGVVFTLGDDCFNRRLVDRWIRDFTHISVNTPWFAAFINRVPAAERAPFVSLIEQLKQADRRRFGWLKRAMFTTALSHYGPFLRYVFATQVLPPWFGSEARAHTSLERDGRFALGRPPRDVSCGLRADEVDQRQIAILTTTLRMLRSRGIRGVLYVHPCAPNEWRSPRTSEVTAAAIAARISEATGAPVVDETWGLTAADFIDPAHYTPEGHQRIARALARAIVDD